MNTSFEKSSRSTDEWYTPKEIIDALGEFDLDPCAPVIPLWRTAKKQYTILDNGLLQRWEGRVWLNPPYSHPAIDYFMKKMSAHKNGIALLFNRADSTLFQEEVFQKADAVLFLWGRIRFFRENGIQGGSPGCGSVLVAYGKENVEALSRCGIKGKLLMIE